MILPNKVVKTDHSLIYIGGLIVNELSNKSNPSNIDELYKTVTRQVTYRLSLERFVLSIDFLNIVGLVTIDNSEVMLCS